MTILLAALVGCATVNNGNPTEQGGPKDISFGDLFASDAGSGGSGGSGGGSSDTDGSGGDSGSWDTGSWDTGGGGGGGGGGGMLEGSLTMQLEFESLDTMDCYGTATFDTSASGLSGTGSCYDDAGDAWDFTFTDAGATVVYEYQPCLEASTDTVYGTVEPGGSLSFNMNLDLASCDSSGEIYVTADVQF